MYKMKIVVLIVVGGYLSLFAQESFFEQDNWLPRMSPNLSTATEKAITPASVDQSVSIDFNDTIAKVLSSNFGNNTISYVTPLFDTYKPVDTSATVFNKTAISHLKNAGITYLRMPGGNFSNLWMWDGSSPDTLFNGGVLSNYQDSIKQYPGGKNQWWQISTAHMQQLGKEIGAHLQPCVNYSLARFINAGDRVEQAAGYAAAWVRNYKDNRIDAPYWEVGNENYGPWQAGYNITERGAITGAEYGQDFNVFADSMKAANPNIKVGAVIFPDSTGYNNWSAGVMPAAANKADYFIIHEYFTYDASDLNNITVQQVLDGLNKIHENKVNYEKMLSQYTTKNSTEIPLAITEFNVRAGLKNMQFVSTVFITRALQQYVKEGYGLVNLWNIMNSGANKSSGEGDHGMLSRKESNVPDNTPHPNFFAYYYSNKFMGNVMIKSENDSSADGNLTVSATKFSDGNAGIIIVNSGTTTQQVELDLQNFTPKDRLYWYEVTGDDGEDYTVDVNGISGSQIIGGPDDYAAIAPYVADISTQQQFTAKPWSVNFLFIPVDNTTSVSANTQKQIQQAYTVRNGILSLPAGHHLTEVQVLNAKGQVLTTLSLNESVKSIALPTRGIGHQVQILKLISGAKVTSILKIK